MKKILRSGNVYMGTCGDPTALYDSNGNNLKVGDLVAIWTRDVKERGWNDKPTFVVQEKIGVPYIMGLKGAHLVRKHIRDGESSNAGHCATILDSYLRDAAEPHNPKETTWYVMRIKSHEQTAIGETWDCGVHPVDEDAETSMEDGITTCCGYDFGLDGFDPTICFCPKCGRKIRRN